MIGRWLAVLEVDEHNGKLHIADAYPTKAQAERHIQEIKRSWPQARVVDRHECIERLYVRAPHAPECVRGLTSCTGCG